MIFDDYCSPDPLAIALLIITAFIGSGVVHVIWLRHPLSKRFQIPLDRGRKFRGRRILGDNKTVRGLMAIIPATGATFLGLALLRPGLPPSFAEGLWELPVWSYAGLGLLAGIGFMAGELPNSFVKRQLGIAPGDAPTSLPLRLATGLFDRIDSIFGVLLVLTLVVPVPWKTWLYVLLLGPGIHFLFSASLYWFRVKERPA